MTQKYGDFLLNCKKIPLIVLCWKSQQSTLWVDFKIKSVLHASQEKEDQILYTDNEERGAATVDSWSHDNAKSEERQGDY